MPTNLPLLVVAPDVTPSVERQLVETLFCQKATVEIVSLTGCVIALAGWARTGQGWFLGWAAVVAATLACRLALGLAYRRRSLAISPRAWAGLFTIGALASAALLGLAGWHAFPATDPRVRFLFLTFLVWTGTGAPARNNAAPLAAIGQACCILLPAALAGAMTGDAYYRLFALVSLVQLAATVKVVRFLGGQTARTLVLNAQVVAAGADKKHLSDALERMNRELQEKNAALSLLSITDELTGLLNRRGFEGRLQREWRRAERNRAPLSLLLIDIDHFKAFNDRFGHLEGDRCLNAVGAAIAGVIARSADEVSRYGGEEFAVILPDTDLAGAAEVAEMVRHAVAACDAGAARGQRVTASIGVATMIPDATLDRYMLVGDADRALYRAKGDGRDRIQLSDEMRDLDAAAVLRPRLVPLVSAA